MTTIVGILLIAFTIYNAYLYWRVGNYVRVLESLLEVLNGAEFEFYEKEGDNDG